MPSRDARATLIGRGALGGLARGALVLGVVLGSGSALAAAASDAPLIAAARQGDVETVRTILARGADVNLAEPDETTALHWAAHRNADAVVDLLIAAGADPGVRNRYGIAPLSLAAENGSLAVARRLLDAGADPRTATPGGETVLMTAARAGAAGLVRLLIARGADPNARERTRGQTALMWAAARNHARTVHALVELGADVHLRTERAARPKRNPIREEHPPPTGFTALVFAARGGHLDAVRALVEAGADVNDTLSDGQSALVVAVANANWELADYLLDRGADPNLMGAGWNALHQAVRTRRMSIGPGTPGPIPSGRLDSIEVIRKLNAKGVDLDARMTRNGMKDGQRNRLNRLGATAFFLASKVTDVEAMRVLLDAGADPLMPTADGTTPLMAAAGVAIYNPGEDGGSLEGQEDEVLDAVRMLVELGNDVNASNYRGETALHGAAFRGASNVVAYLVEQGADLEARTTQYGLSPLAIAAGLSYTEFYKAQVETADLLRRLMAARGISTEGHTADGSICYDCRQTRADQQRAWEAREARMEALFDPEQPVIPEALLGLDPEPRTIGASDRQP